MVHGRLKQFRHEASQIQCDMFKEVKYLSKFDFLNLMQLYHKYLVQQKNTIKYVLS